MRYGKINIMKMEDKKMMTIKDFIKDTSHLNEAALVDISDQLWQIGSLSEIKQQVSHELFILHISMNMIGNWKGEGWWGVISEQAELVPYIPEALQALQLNHLKTAFEDVISIFPAYTIFSNDNECYYDMINFLQNVRFKVTDERLLMIPSEKRKEMVTSIKQKLDILEDLTEPLWGYGAESDGWIQVIDYIKTQL
ncbi:hypothetical protein DXA09_07130 [Absiella sp. AM54-8XD]|jgi:hypothetical protein|nr:hypothetical protein DW271_13625 [Absiella sp. AM22-9]RGB57050.1 hypothetical protein DW120_15235 [Absiella sp. AM10-20]RGB68101.1 hypothetical protein DW113_04830 [Absiella sp. AM09-45]RGB79318.1 hypothetical protein DW114_01375 [Absiella sp. AM09-50]RGC23458.1 hypothetical protein DXA09_07130 [Absiella sp. AM54-8XD]